MSAPDEKQVSFSEETTTEAGNLQRVPTSGKDELSSAAEFALSAGQVPTDDAVGASTDSLQVR